MKIRLLIAMILTVLIVNSVFADDDPMTPWPIEEQCISQPTQPPDDWTYSGTLLMAGYAGIHAMRADWDTPRIEAFFSTDALGYPLEGGQLSPDSRWYAVPVGTVTVEPSFNQFWHTNALRIYSLVDDRVLDFVIDDYADELDYRYYCGCSWTLDTVQWLDNETLIVGGLLIRPFDAEVVLAPFWSGWFNLYLVKTTFSPDVQRVVGVQRIQTTRIGVYNPRNPDEMFTPIELLDGVAWRHSSDGFVAEHFREPRYEIVADYLSLYSRDGEFVEVVFDPEGGSLDIERIISGRNELGWSGDDVFFAFVFTPPDAPARLMLIDTENELVIDTCLSPSSQEVWTSSTQRISQPIWSPDSTQIAILMTGGQNHAVVIIDMERWQAYRVATHINRRGALNADMIGWIADGE